MILVILVYQSHEIVNKKWLARCKNLPDILGEGPDQKSAAESFLQAAEAAGHSGEASDYEFK